MGARNHEWLTRSYGLRELAAGAGILSNRKPAAWLWSRVAGDIVDLTSLGLALKSRRNKRRRTLFGIASVAGVTALDVKCALHMTQHASAPQGRAEASIVVGNSSEEAYRFWRNVENMPRFMTWLQSVSSTGDRRSHWIAKPDGRTALEWDSEIVDEVPHQRISWRTLPGAAVPNSGSVEFEPVPGGRGTLVRAQLQFSGPAAALDSPLLKLIGHDAQQVMRKTLFNFRQVLETGEVLTTEGQSAGRRSGATWLDRTAKL
ncbi:MAG: SRPBCC family protein [Bryobacteraceae bacterium]